MRALTRQFLASEFRATCATNWLRSPKFGGKAATTSPLFGELLGHDDYKSIEAYLAYVRREELIEVDSQKIWMPLQFDSIGILVIPKEKYSENKAV